jgi:hypothetical protein
MEQAGIDAARRKTVWKPCMRSSCASEAVETMVPRPALWNQRSQAQVQPSGTGKRAAA